MKRFLLAIILLIVLPDVYIWHFHIKGESLWWLVLLLATSIVALAAVLAGMHISPPAIMVKIVVALLLSILLPKILFVLICSIGKGVCLLFPDHRGAITMVSTALGIVVALVTLCAGVYGATLGWKKVTLKEVEMSFPTLPDAFDGYRIVQVSDLHIGTYAGAPETVEKIVDLVNAQDADMIVFTGDLVNTDPKELDNFMEVLPRLKARDGVFSILGNHDYCQYIKYETPGGQKENIQELIRRERGFGWDILLNENRIVSRDGDSIAIVGVENDSRPPFPSRGDLPKATKGLPEGIFKVLLSHDPTHWRRNVLPDTDIELTLSGHTHAMQVKIGGFSPASFVYDEWGGLYEEGQRKLHVSVGTGCNFAFRLGAWNEIDVITLRRAENK